MTESIDAFRDDETRLRLPELARRIECHPATVRSWVAAGKLRCVTLGIRQYITKADFARYVESCNEPAGAAT
jgi:hypothetical protein